MNLPKTPLKKGPIATWIIAGSAVLFPVFLTLQQYLQHLVAGYDFPFSWESIFTTELANYLVWFVLWPMLALACDFFRDVKGPRKSDLLKGALLLMAVVLIHRLLTHGIHDIIYYLQSGYWRDFFGRNSLTALTAGLFKSLVEGLIFTGLMSLVDYQKRNAAQERQLARAQLDALRLQVNPHFLFNTLHSITTLVDLDPKAAQKMIAKLGSLFRKVLKSDEKDLVTIEEELHFVGEYLAIEEVRFQDTLRVQWDIDEGTKKTLIPNMVLQPVIENAIKHGGPGKDGIHNVHVIARYTTSGVLLAVANHVGAKNSNRNGEGIGLRNVKARLDQYYEQYEFRSGMKTEDTYETVMTIPI